jgi:hypothetical protein
LQSHGALPFLVQYLEFCAGDHYGVLRDIRKRRTPYVNSSIRRRRRRRRTDISTA